MKAQLSNHVYDMRKERMAAMTLHRECVGWTEWLFQYDDKCGSHYTFLPSPKGVLLHRRVSFCAAFCATCTRKFCAEKCNTSMKNMCMRCFGCASAKLFMCLQTVGGRELHPSKF
eukprot:5457390-Pleurochrysis_carterae.AAC.1